MTGRERIRPAVLVAIVAIIAMALAAAGVAHLVLGAGDVLVAFARATR